mmetsp:Transcript_27679/g.46441  ORF Transcript_27679/g.46441 Transcript_27679/m.46441 type:complete len:219 (+) Transcript_27679:1641-2297(+)
MNHVHIPSSRSLHPFLRYQDLTIPVHPPNHKHLHLYPVYQSRPLPHHNQHHNQHHNNNKLLSPHFLSPRLLHNHSNKNNNRRTNMALKSPHPFLVHQSQVPPPLPSSPHHRQHDIPQSLSLQPSGPFHQHYLNSISQRHHHQPLTPPVHLLSPQIPIPIHRHPLLLHHHPSQHPCSTLLPVAHYLSPHHLHRPLSRFHLSESLRPLQKAPAYLQQSLV